MGSLNFPSFECYDGTSCFDCSHHAPIVAYANGVISCLSSALKSLLVNRAHSEHNFRQIPGWNSQVRCLYRESRKHFIRWVEGGRPTQGQLYEVKKESKARFRCALRRCRIEKDVHLSEKLAHDSLDKRYGAFWKTVRDVSTARIASTARVGTAHGSADICSFWKGHYESLFTSVPNSALEPGSTGENFSFQEFSTNEIMVALSALPKGKSPGSDNISMEAFQIGSDIIAPFLNTLFNTCVRHAFLPSVLTEVLITPVLKSKSFDKSEASSYRPIAVSTALSKIFEYMVHSRLKQFLYPPDHLCSEPSRSSRDNQFGFKKGVGTESCVFLLKESIRSYICKDSYVHCAFLDASKAFDRVNHRKLFEKLSEKGVPLYLLSLLRSWYSNQCMYIKWNNFVSEKFEITNGVRQGSLISPLLFTVYMEALSDALNVCNVGIYVGFQQLNHLLYADDLVLLSPSLFGLRTLLQACETFAFKHDIIFNSKKSFCMRFCARPLDFKPGCIFLNGLPLQWTESVKYLGVSLSTDLGDKAEIESQLRNFYARSNYLIRKFYFCTHATKLLLFQSFCTSFYLSHLWYRYPEYIYRRFKVAYNNMFRKFLGLPRNCSASGMLVRNRVENFEALHRKSFALFFIRLDLCTNKFVSSFLCSDAWYVSPLRSIITRLTSV